ncbi:head-to-tail connector protein [Gordonia phage Terapin]|uniref:Head-to-tail connector complex protein n=5 Tax=Terapinvirus terapin TaxID=2734283 RepID=A0A345MB56_9CAUD|nr:head-to-tail connector protein [Gordonia phage Terapin]AVP43293.1 head-tail-connector complex protein [Gordonia phage Djokovic]AXH67727.1 head-to-tail connector complex protein [Gordonia phage Beyoncage]QOC56161.1 tail terminator [Gordonia phage Sienna]QOC56586.1 tail terminator [Gordonia phage BiteSize]QYW00819.1 tail terminator [Gordonia phage Madi]
MSSGAVYQALTNDPTLQTLCGGTDNFVFPDYAMESAPRDGVFLILRWGAQDVTRAIRRGPVDLIVWAHQPKEDSTDYTLINRVLNRARDVLEAMPNTPGPDDIRVNDVAFQGNGGNLYDPGFQTITKNSVYRVLLA